ncbi:MAG: helix-turn-helix transcriptional regulator [Gemmatimonadaceae bacterium]|nr:helix-turn-helix transcriptional regulator [Gemmatimonadaceae bacterium]
MPHILSTATTDEILRELGQRLQRYRLQQNRTAVDVARDAGIGLRTLERAEAGERPTLATFIQILRALGRLDAFEAFLPAPLVSPLQLAELSGQERRRAGTPRKRGSPRSEPRNAQRP